MITTTHRKAADAYVALIRIGNRVVPSGIAYKLYLLKKALTDSVEFQREQEKKLIKKYDGKPMKNGKIAFDEEERGMAFKEEFDSMKDSEITVKTDKFTMFLDEINEISLSEIEALEDFVDFKERGEVQ